MSVNSFPLLVATHKDQLMPFAIQLTQDKDKAADLFQETVARALQHSQSFTQGTNLRAWLFTIMRNTFINEYRRQQRQPMMYCADVSMETHHHPLTENRGPGNLLARELHQALHALPAAYRIAFELYYQGHRYNAIAHMLRQPLGTIKSRIHSARRMLMKSIER